jgi:hypothetical protein
MNVWKEQDLVFENRHYLMHTGLSVTIFGEIQKNMVSNFKSTELTYVPRGIGQWRQDKWEHVEEHFRNPVESYKNIMGTFWKLSENILRTKKKSKQFLNKISTKTRYCNLHIYTTSGYPWPSDTVTYDITFSSINNIMNSIHNKTT